MTNKINKNYNIQITDWMSNLLYEGEYDDPQVDVILDANRCDCNDNERENCVKCDGTGYVGEFSVEWCDENGKDDITENVYECINY